MGHLTDHGHVAGVGADVSPWQLLRSCYTLSDHTSQPITALHLSSDQSEAVTAEGSGKIDADCETGAGAADRRSENSLSARGEVSEQRNYESGIIRLKLLTKANFNKTFHLNSKS